MMKNDEKKGLHMFWEKNWWNLFFLSWWDEFRTSLMWTVEGFKLALLLFVVVSATLLPIKRGVFTHLREKWIESFILILMRWTQVESYFRDKRVQLSFRRVW
jgi:hypothetical protein